MDLLPMNQYKPIHIQGLVSTSTKLNFLLFVLKCLLSNLKGLQLFHVVFDNSFIFSDQSQNIRTVFILQHLPPTLWSLELPFFGSFSAFRSFLKCSKQNCTGYSSCSLVLNKRRMFVSLVFSLFFSVVYRILLVELDVAAYWAKISREQYSSSQVSSLGCNLTAHTLCSTCPFSLKHELSLFFLLTWLIKKQTNK